VAIRITDTHRDTRKTCLGGGEHRPSASSLALISGKQALSESCELYKIVPV